ncbi:MAG: hypothetical protein AAGD11_04330 [Planctomycetota bacterium]
MYSEATVSRFSRGSKRGISLVEFVGCMAALGGGVVLGSMYLGVDVKAAAVGLLEKADIEVPAMLADASSNDAPSSETESTPAEPNADVASAEGPSLTESDVAVDTDDAPVDQNADVSAPRPTPPVLSEAEQLVATKNCWLALSEAMKVESTNRAKSIRDPGNWQLFDYLLHRQRGHSKVVAAIEAIDLNGVDPRLKAHVAQVLVWHRAGADLFERATQLLTDAPAGKLSGPFAQSWQSASTQHRMEEKLILNKHRSVASYLEHAHKVPAT